MTILKTHSYPILGLLGLSPSRRHGSNRTRRRPLPLNLERFEDRVVPAYVDPSVAATLSAVQLIDAKDTGTAPVPLDPTFNKSTNPNAFYSTNDQKFSQNHQGEISVTIQLNLYLQSVQDALKNTDGIQVTVDSFVLKNPAAPADQTLVRTLTHTFSATLTAAKPTVTVSIEVDDVLCSQVDAYYGTPTTNTDTNILAGAIFHPSFDSKGVETFIDEATNLSDAGAQAHIKQDCKEANIGNEGLTIGFWKNHYANWQSYTPDTTLGSIFAGLDDSSYAPGHNPYSSLENVKFSDALSLGGGPSLSDKAGLLVKQAVGALLNASNSQVGYPLMTVEIKVAVNKALASMDPNAIDTLQGQFDTMNSVDVSSITNPINNHQKK